MDKQVELKLLMEQRKKSVADIAKLLDRSESTVRMWRSKGGKRPIPDAQLKLLKFLLDCEF